MIKSADIVPVLDNVMEVVTEAFAAHEADQTKIAQLENQLRDQEKVILEKVAAPTQVFKPETITRTLDRLREMNIIDQAMAVKFASDIQRDPHNMLGLLIKISEALISSPQREGEGIEKEAGVQGNDPKSDDHWKADGWEDFVEGRTVKPKQ